MPRITRQTLCRQTFQTCRALGLPPEAIWPQRSATGWHVYREAGPHGAAAPLGECLTAGEALALLQGLEAAARLAAPSESQALALLACSELEAAAAAGTDAEALALPVALARMATGAAPVRPVINGWRLAPQGLELTGATGETLLRLPGRISPAGGLAAALAAGWQLTAPMRATAARHAGQPDGEALAAALAARGECPAAIAACLP